MLLKKYIQYIHYASARPWLLVGLTLLVLAASFPVFDIHTDKDGSGWFPKNSRQLVAKNQFIKDFGSDELMMLYLTFPDSSSDETRLNTLQQIGDSITAKIYGFENVFSRYNVSVIRNEMGDKYAGKLERAYFSSNDSAGEMIFLKVRYIKDIITIRPFMMDSLDQVLKSILPANVKVSLSGQSVVFNEINRLSTSDSARLFALCFALIILILWWQIRKVQYLVLCIALVLLALIPSLALFGWLNIPFNMITMTVPLLFVINFSSFAVHIITKQSHDLEKYLHKKIPPILTSALATIIGFGSLTTSNIRLISQFGELTSLGIIFGLFILLLIGVPLTVKFIGINERVDKPGLLNNILDAYYKRITRSISVISLFITFAVIAWGVYIFPRINTDTNMINFMKHENPVRQTIEYIEEHYGAANVIDFMITKKENGQLTNEDIKKIAGLNTRLTSLPFVKNTVSYDLWKPLVNRAMATDAKLSTGIKRNFLSKDKNRTRITVNIPSGSVKEMERMLIQVEQVSKNELKNSGMEIVPVGFLPLYVEQMDTIVDGMLYGLALAVVLILLVMIFLVRDIKLGLITIFVTLFPLCGLAILMHLMTIPFDVGTSIISSVAIGMIADDALHIIWNYKRYMKKNRDKSESINTIFANSTRKIIYPCTVTSVMFSIGFAVLMWSNMIIIVHFGLLTAATIALAWLSDFILFPALLNIFYKRKNEEVLVVKERQ